MDDLKLYQKNDYELDVLLKTVKTLSDDIDMAFGLDKCAKATLIRGKLKYTSPIVLDTDTKIMALDQEETQKYLAINTLAVPVVTYSFHVVNWNLEEIK